MLKNKSILITGGTGSFGSRFAEYILNNFKHIKKIVIFSRDELKQHDMSLRKPFFKNKKVRFFLGDIRDKSRLLRAFSEIDIVVHAAALKQVPAAEYNPIEFVKTNIIGSQNIIEACIDKNVKQLIALSTDKAVSPINLYGATKLCADKLFLAANNYAGIQKYKFSVVRYGNVISSRGSVIPKFKEINKDKNKSYFPVTSDKMTRFLISLEEGIKTVIFALKNQIGGEIFVPKIPSARIVDICKAINPKKKIKIVGVRPGEKIHEELISEFDSLNTIDIGNYYLILPSQDNDRIKKIYIKKFSIKKLSESFSYNSLDNKYLNISQLKNILSL
tara:strand:+ start:110 stop:1105 length:996 start_codon:yes stop_codon:yes gene_type:complete